MVAGADATVALHRLAASLMADLLQRQEDTHAATHQKRSMGSSEGQGDERMTPVPLSVRLLL